MGVLSWLIEDGEAEGIDLSGLPAALACRYSDDEPGSPWTWILYLDERASSEQRRALEQIFTGQLDGDAKRHFPWAWKPSDPLGFDSARIEIDHTPGGGWFRVGRKVEVRVSAPYAGPETVTCVIPGHERSGRELVVDELHVDAGLLAFEYRGVCAYESTFDYSG